MTQVENLQEYEKPLVAHLQVAGSMGTVTSKRMILPMDVFVAEEPGTFPHEKRDMPAYFHYAHMMQDAVRVKFPVSMTLEAAPTDAKVNFENMAQYTLTSSKVANSVTVRRNLIFNGVIVPQKDFGTLRTFYWQLESKDKDSIVLKAVGPTTATAGN